MQTCTQSSATETANTKSKKARKSSSITATSPAGEKITFDSVLAVGGDGDAKLGSPLVKGASVAAEVIGPEKGEKLVIQKMRRRKNFRRKTGERHIFTRVRIGKISV